MAYAANTGVQNTIFLKQDNIGYSLMTDESRVRPY